MSGEPLVARWTRPARVRGAADDLAIAAPAALVLALAVARVAGWGTGAALGMAALAAAAAVARARSRRFGRGWLVARLNASTAELEDSADLLLADPAALGPVQRLQRARIEARLAPAPPDLRPAWSARRIAAAWAAGVAAALVILLWPAPRPARDLAPSAEGVAAAPGVPRLVGQRLRVVPPAYTGVPPRDLAVLDARVPQGSRLTWTLAFVPEPSGASLQFLDGRRVALTHAGGRWTAAVPLDRSALYRVVPAGAATLAHLHRLDAVADRPPQVEALAPSRTLSIAGAGQRGWALAFHATDDYGVAPRAQLRVTVASGEGEQVSFREHLLAVTGTGPPRARRFALTLDLLALGFTGPGDLVAQLTVVDARAGAPQAARGPSLILRRAPPPARGGAGLDGAVRSLLPGFLRSQRQVVNDAEALVRERRSIAPARFADRSQSIGADQHALRMHYGGLTGQETETAGAALPTADAPPAALGREEDVLGSFGQEHDGAEGDTLFDPITRGRLRDAVDQMWQSERALDQGDPAGALPFANRALVLIKQVQQATRVFLARVGTTQLPVPDEARRLTGKRDDLSPGDLAVPPRAGSEAAATAAWAAVDRPGGGAGLGRVARWLRSGTAAGGDALAIEAALDGARRDPGCAGCRERLRALVWAALRRPPPGVARRPAGDAAGQAYLRGIGPAR